MSLFFADPHRWASRTCQHADHRQQDLLHTLDRTPPLRTALVSHRIIPRGVEDGNTHPTIGINWERKKEKKEDEEDFWLFLGLHRTRTSVFFSPGSVIRPATGSEQTRTVQAEVQTLFKDDVEEVSHDVVIKIKNKAKLQDFSFYYWLEAETWSLFLLLSSLQWSLLHAHSMKSSQVQRCLPVRWGRKSEIISESTSAWHQTRFIRGW